MDLVLCHTTADFDTLGAAVGVSCLRPGSRIVLTGGADPTVQAFLALWRDEYALIERRAVPFDQVRSLTLVDAHRRDRFAPVSDWIQRAEQTGLPIYIYDHHAPTDDSASGLERDDDDQQGDLPTAEVHIEAVGAATTLVAELLQRQQIAPSPFEATVMALGIHSDTGSLTFEQATARDAAALAWLMAQGANQQVIAENKDPGLSPQLQSLLSTALETIEVEQVRGHQLGWLKLETDKFVPGLSGLAGRLVTLLGLDTLLLYAQYRAHQKIKAVMIGRSRTNPLQPDSSVDLRPIFAASGGGGHAQAAATMLKGDRPEDLQASFQQAVAAVRSQIPHPITARSLMSSPVRTILPTTSVDEAQGILLRYGHVGLCVVTDEGALVGMISRRDIDIALRHGLGHGPVKGCMSVQIKSIAPETPITQIQDLMMTYDIGRLPVLAGEKLVGIVTRTDLLRQLHQTQQVYRGNRVDQARRLNPSQPSIDRLPSAGTLYQQLEGRISEIWPALMLMAEAAEQKGWALYLVGGAVRDLLLSLSGQPYPLTDIDLVVDGVVDGAEAGAGVILAEAMRSRYPQVAVQVHGQFQTASLIWPSMGPSTGPPVEIDIATARTEFYPYPAANPEVEASTIRQDLYRRDFTINAMALRLNGPQPGHLLDFFGGWLDLQQQQVRVLHANSFVEDPTRIFRAVRFAVRLGFTLDGQTEQFISYAIDSGIYARMQAAADKTPALQTRLKAELKYMLEAPQWETALAKIDALGALICLHSCLEMTPTLWRQLRRMDRWLKKVEIGVPHWLMLLELIIAQLEPAERDRTATNLDLGGPSLHRLKHLHQWETDLARQLPQAQRPSQLYRLLQPYDRPELLLMSDRHPHTLGAPVWQYIFRLSAVPPLINGGTLKQLGYKPGPQFRDILSAVHAATLDGELTSAEAATNYVLAHYPPGS